MKYIIEGGQKLKGSVKISGNKNSVFPCLAAAILTEEEVILENMPKITDSDVMAEILQKIGVSIKRLEGKFIIQANNPKNDLPDDLVTKLRGSIVLAGALLGRIGQVAFHHPGGDIIGRRSIDVHLEALKQLGIQIKENNLKFTLTKKRQLQEEKIFLKETSVTGTENLILFSVLSDGVVTIRNCASEPHIIDLCNMLNNMGARIKGIGTNTLIIYGVKKLHGTCFRLGDDHIEIGTYAIASAVTGGEIEIICGQVVDLDPLICVLQEFGIQLKKTDSGFKVETDNLKSVKVVKTNIWPGFPTDLMSAVIILATQCEGITLCHDWMYESRMFFADKLISMGAHITIADPHRVMIYGPTPLQGRKMDTPDIRAGMALVLAALVATGESVINDAELIERGYENVANKLLKLGAKIEKSAD